MLYAFCTLPIGLHLVSEHAGAIKADFASGPGPARRGGHCLAAVWCVGFVANALISKQAQTARVWLVIVKGN